MPGLLRGVQLAHVASPPRYISSSFSHTHTHLHTYTLQRICVQFRARVPVHTHRLVFIMHDSLRLRIFNANARTRPSYTREFSPDCRKSLVHNVAEGCTGNPAVMDILTMKRNLRFLSASPHGNLISTSGWNATLCERGFFSNRKSRVWTKIGKWGIWMRLVASPWI